MSVDPIKLAEQRQIAEAERYRSIEKQNGIILAEECSQAIELSTQALRDRHYVDFRVATWNDEKYAIFDSFYIDDDNGRMCGLPLIAVANSNADILWVVGASRVHAKHAFNGGEIANLETLTNYVHTHDKGAFYTRETIAFLTALQLRADPSGKVPAYPFDRFSFSESYAIQTELEVARAPKLLR